MAYADAAADRQGPSRRRQDIAAWLVRRDINPRGSPVHTENLIRAGMSSEIG